MKNKINNIGLHAEKPEGACQSSKCPWHGNVKIRGRIFKGKIVSVKALRTAIISWDYYNFIPKYERYERRRTRVAAHLPACINAKTGDTVRIGECRPLSKSKNFVVFEVLKDHERH
jgi:small subunit ribosomal protein S17